MKAHQILDIPQDDYEIIIWNLWMVWCCKKSITPVETQKLLINQQLFDSWQNKYSAIEKNFKIESKKLPEILDTLNVTIMFLKFVLEIHNYNPKSLINLALKNDRKTN